MWKGTLCTVRLAAKVGELIAAMVENLEAHQETPRHYRRKWQPGAPRLRETGAGISVHRHTTAGDRCAHGWLPRLADGETQSSEDGSSQGRRCVNEFREARKRSAHVAMPVGQAGSSALSHDDRSSRVGPLATRGCSEARYTPFASDRVRDCSEYSQ